MKNLKGKYNFKIDIKKSEPACMQCLPPAPLRGHKSLNGILVHSRIDCPPDSFYLINPDLLTQKTD